MVGAELIGEYCWSVEQLLNRVIDGTVPRTPELVGYCGGRYLLSRNSGATRGRVNAGK